MEFNEKLQQLRKERGLTQEELAQKLFVSRTAISKWESGRGYPNIDSLRAIAEFFSVTVDNLISSSEVVAVAKAEQNQKTNNFTDLVFGLIDISFIMLFILPLFANKSGESVISTSLVALNSIQPYLKYCYFALIFAIVLIGVLFLTLQNFQKAYWINVKCKISLCVNLLLTLVLVVSLQPYPATLSLTLLVIKACVLIKR